MIQQLTSRASSYETIAPARATAIGGSEVATFRMVLRCTESSAGQQRSSHHGTWQYLNMSDVLKLGIAVDENTVVHAAVLLNEPVNSE